MGNCLNSLVTSLLKKGVKCFLGAWLHWHDLIVLQAQFLMVTLHAAPVLFLQNCNYPKPIAGLMVFQYSFMFILFLDFYRKAYRKKTA